MGTDTALGLVFLAFMFIVIIGWVAFVLLTILWPEKLFKEQQPPPIQPTIRTPMPPLVNKPTKETKHDFDEEELKIFLDEK